MSLFVHVIILEKEIKCSLVPNIAVKQ